MSIDLTGTEPEVVQRLNKLYEQHRQARLPFEKQWYINLSFFRGKQWVTWAQGVASTSLAQLVEIPEGRHQSRLVANRIMSYVRREMARLASDRPRGFVVPNSTENRDQAAARAGEAILAYLNEQLQVDQIHAIADFWTVICGTSFLKCVYDPNARNQHFPEYPGLPRLEVCSPFNILVPNLEQDLLERQEWVMHVAYQNVEYINELYDVDLKPQKVGTGDDNSMTQLHRAQDLTQDHQISGTVLVKEIWVAPCGKYPNGIKVTWTKDKMLDKEEWTLPHGQFPFVKREHTLAGSFYGETFVSQQIALQKEYNRRRSQLMDAANRMGNPGWVVTAGSVRVQDFTNKPGQIIPVRPGFNPPSPIKAAEPSMVVYNSMTQAREEMDDLASQHEVSKGSVPPNVEAATAIGYLQEKDDMVVAQAVHSKERAVQTVGKFFLSYVAAYWDAERLVPIVGTNGNFDAFTFKGADLFGNTDYRVVPGSGLPQARAAKQAMIMELMKGGFITPELGLAHLDMGDVAAIHSKMQVGIKQAERENLRMQSGTYELRNPWDDDIEHLSVHDEFAKTEEYESLPEEIQMLFRTHAMQHMIELVSTFGMQAMVGMLPDPNAPYDPAYEAALRRVVNQIKLGMVSQPNAQQTPTGPPV